MPLLVDGYNLLRTVQKDEQFEEMRESGLCRIISDYLVTMRDRGHVIFDGTGPPDKEEMEQLGGLDNLEVYFSGEHSDADTVIEQKIEDNTAPKSLVVVSTDRAVRAAAGRRKATSVRSDVFWQQLLLRLENRRKPANEPGAKRQGISDIETDQWLDLFGMDKD
ncbi:MAG: NYN domain-containing protein [Phycisphaerae bacterium]|nr:NYN domain-containing protein [Phycisphaerae bacterium]